MKITIRQRNYPGNRKVWTCDIHVTPAGEQASDRFRLTAPDGVTSRGGAERWARDQARRLVAEGRPFNTRKARAQRERLAKEQELARGPTLRAWWPTWMEALELEGHKPGGLDKRESVWKCWLEPQFGDLELRACTAELELQRLRRRTADAKVSVGHTTSVLHILMACLRRAALAYPHLGLVVPRVKTVRRPKRTAVCYPHEDNVALLAVATVDERAHLLLMLDAGLRIGEVCALAWSDLSNLDQLRGSARVTVRGTVYEGTRGRTGAARHTPPRIVPPKSGETREVPLTSRLVAALQQLQATATTPWVCPAAGNPWPCSYTTLFDRMRSLTKRAGVAWRRCHAWRHTFATEALRAGADLKTVGGYLGHADVSTTEMYLHSTDHEARAGIAALEAMRAGVTPLAPLRRLRSEK